jgi:cyclin-dependent kinase 12/13
MDAETLDEVAPGVTLRYAPSDWGVRSLNRYAIGDAIGEGTYGKVFKAHELVSGRREAVALKMMIRHHEDEGFPKTETREIKILKSLRHPNMVNLREVVSSLGSDVYQPKPSTVSATKATTHGSADSAGVGLFDRMGDIFMVFDYVDYDLAGLLESGYRYARRLCVAM